MTEGPAALFAAILGVTLIGGAIAAVSVREARAAILGLLIVVLAAPFLADPLPDWRGIVARLAGGVLTAYPLLIAIRGAREITLGSRGGWPADALLAATAAFAGVAAAAGWDLAGQLGGGGEPEAAAQLPAPFLPAIGAGAAVLVLAAAPVAVARDPLRLAIGLILGIVGLTLLQAGLSGPPTAFTNLCVAVVLATISAGGWAIARAARRGTARGATNRPPGRASSSGDGVAGGRPSLAAELAARDRAGGPAHTPPAGPR